MAQGSKSGKNKAKAETSDDTEAEVSEPAEPASEAESTDDAPVVIEGEAAEVQAESDGAGGSSPSEELSSEGSQAEAVPPATPAPQQQEPESGGPGALTLVLGGILAGAIGYGASYLVPSPKPLTDPDLSASISATEARMDELTANVAALMEAPTPEVVETDLSPIEAQLGELSEQIATITSEITVLESSLDQTSAALEAGTEDLSQRIAALEVADRSGLPEASEEQIAAFRERLEAITADAETRLNVATERAAELEAQAAARAEEIEAAAAARVAEMQAAAESAEQEAARIEAEARRRAALAEVSAALENGTAFAPALETLGQAPDGLAIAAEKGVPTLLELQRAFPQAARAALTQATTIPQDASTGERISAFLKRRTGARSLTPQEGSTPDAILSRAEAALETGDLDTTLAEIEMLPEPSQAALSDWTQRARIRAEALVALDSLSATN